MFDEREFKAYKTSTGHLLMESNDFGWDYTLVNDDGVKITDGMILSGDMPALATAKKICSSKYIRVLEEERYDDILETHLIASISN